MSMPLLVLAGVLGGKVAGGKEVTVNVDPVG